MKLLCGEVVCNSKNNSSEWTIGSFLLQQILVPLGGLVLGGGLLVWIADLFRTAPPVIREFGEVLACVAPLSAAFVSGYRIRRRWPWVYGAGRIVWIAPAVLLLLFLLIDLASSRSASSILSEYFYPRPGEEDIGVVLFTWPVLCCCLYSGGMVAGHRRAAHHEAASAPRANIRKK